MENSSPHAVSLLGPVELVSQLEMQIALQYLLRSISRLGTEVLEHKSLLLTWRWKNYDETKNFPAEYIYLFRSLGLIFGCYFFIVKKEPSVHVLTEAFVGVAIIVVQIFRSHIHASSNPPAERSDGLKHNILS